MTATAASLQREGDRLRFSGTLDRSAATALPFWRMASASVNDLSVRASQVVLDAGRGTVVASEALPGAGSAPGVVIPSVAVAVEGDHLAALRAAPTPIVARTRDGITLLDLRTIDPADDAAVVAAVAALPHHRAGA